MNNLTNAPLVHPHPKTPAERARTYRQRRRAEGLKTVKALLAPDAMAYLNGLCEIHDLTLSEAIALAVTRMVRGES